jgi:hypothetical protein
METRRRKQRHVSRIQVPVDVAMEEPWAGVIGEESDGHEIRFAGPDTHDIADDRVDEVVGVASGAPDHIKGMLVKRSSACELITRAHVL